MKDLPRNRTGIPQWASPWAAPWQALADHDHARPTTRPAVKRSRVAIGVSCIAALLLVALFTAHAYADCRGLIDAVECACG